MDDEATIRVTFICVAGAVLIVLGMVFGMGLARDGVPEATARSATAIATLVVPLCKEVPASQRLACISKANEAVVIKACTNSELSAVEPGNAFDANAMGHIDECVATAEKGTINGR